MENPDVNASDLNASVHRQPTEEAPCKQACPAGIDVPRYVRLIGEGKFGEAVSVIREKIPFISVCGYVCTHPCEEVCRLGRVKNAVAIRALKRFAAEHDNRQWVELSKIEPSTGKSVAIVGSGPAGLTAGYYLAKLGHSVVVFEELPAAGGMLRVGIPPYRLPRHVLDAEIDEVRKVGVEIKAHTRVESAFNLIKEGYNAVLIATGAHEAIRLGVPGEDTPHVVNCVQLLKDISLGKEVTLLGKVLVIGGGNVAIDGARVARRLGAIRVDLFCLESREDMPADTDQVEEAEDEGVTVHTSYATTRILRENEHIRGVEFIRLRSMGFEDGQLWIDAIKGSEHVIPADWVICAIGQKPKLSVVLGDKGIDISKRGTIIVDPDTLNTSKSGITAAGDVVTGTKTVIEAIVAGRKAAASIDKYLGGNGAIEETLAQREEGAKEVLLGKPVGGRAVIPSRPAQMRLGGFDEVELSLSEEGAIREANRCLWCDMPVVADATICTGCQLCQLVCSFINLVEFNPARSYIVCRADERKGLFELEFTDDCTACGLCVKYCPSGALVKVNLSVGGGNTDG